MKENLARQIDSLGPLKKEIEFYGSKLTSLKQIGLFDTFCIAQLNRSLSLVDAFILLSRAGNFITSMALVRLHLDTLLRIYAVRISGLDVNTAVEKILTGERIDRFRHDLKGPRLKDTYLKDELSKLADFVWVNETYKVTSGFVHFSDSILKSSNTADLSSQTLKHTITVGSDFITDDDKIIACTQMKKITQGILGFIDSWLKFGQSRGSSKAPD